MFIRWYQIICILYSNVTRSFFNVYIYHINYASYIMPFNIIFMHIRIYLKSENEYVNKAITRIACILYIYMHIENVSSVDMCDPQIHINFWRILNNISKISYIPNPNPYIFLFKFEDFYGNLSGDGWICIKYPLRTLEIDNNNLTVCPNV